MLLRMQGKGTLIHCWWECKLVQPLQKSTWQLLRKLEIDVIQEPAILKGHFILFQRHLLSHVHMCSIYNS